MQLTARKFAPALVMLRYVRRASSGRVKCDLSVAYELDPISDLGLFVIKHLLVAALIALTPEISSAAGPLCNEQFESGTPPRVTNPKLFARSSELCFTGFATLFSGVTRTPLYSAEHLTRERIRSAKETKRRNAFHEEMRLAAADRSELADYARSGFDRGHMAPSGNMPDPQSQHESFSLANMIPQDPDNNRRL